MDGHSQDEIRVRPATRDDAAAVARIYNHYVTETTVTFEEEALTEKEIGRRIEEVQSVSLPWLVAEQGGDVMGYAYGSRWKDRSAYRFSAEVTVYVDHGCARRGLGSALYRRLLPALGSAGIHVTIGCIALPNDPSIRLHEKFGFEKVAHLKDVGFKLNRWIDVGYWQVGLR